MLVTLSTNQLLHNSNVSKVACSTEVNMIVSAFESESFMSEADAVLAHENTKANAEAGWATHYPLHTLILGA